jgi:hypothetical protein
MPNAPNSRPNPKHQRPRGVKPGMRNHFELPSLPRRTLLSKGLAAGGIGLSSIFASSARAEDPDKAVQRDDFPHMQRPSVRDFVGACHGKIDVVREMLSQRPGLMHAAWDWGFGDFETGLGAASHTGQREIAELLIAAGARVDIFAAAMLGWTDVVRAMIAADVRVKSALGPHGIPLLGHALAGGEAAAGTVALLQELGGADQSPILTAALPSDQVISACVGRYHIASIDESIEIRKDSKGRLECVPAQGSARAMYLMREREFFPSGAPSVTLRFDNRTDRSTTLTIMTGVTTFEGTRAD